MPGLQFRTSFDHPRNKVTRRTVGFEMVRHVVFTALIPPEIEGVQELCVVQAETLRTFEENYPFSCVYSLAG